MHCNTEDFRELSEQLQEPERELSRKALDLLGKLQDDLSGLLATPAKSDSARQTLAKGLIKVDGAEFKLSQKFMNTSAEVADELGLDEMLAAQFVFYASQSSKRLGIELHQAALLLFYYRRAHILDICRALVEIEPTNYDVSKILGKEPTVIVKALTGVQRSIEDLNERLQRGRFLQNDQNPQFVPTIEAQHNFLVEEHQILACILHRLVCQGKVGEPTIQEILKEAATFSSYGSHLYAYLVPLIAYFRKHEIKPGSFDSEWRSLWWKGGVATLYCAFHPNDKLMRSSINDGGLELLAAMAKDIRPEQNITFNDFSLLRTRVPPLNAQVLPLIASLIVCEFEAAIAAFVANNAHILREMRLSEEDAYLSGDSAQPGVDLERFFLFVSYLYEDRPDSSLEIWHNPGSALYGFLKWGSTIQAAFISAAYNEMLGSLACGPQAALAASHMLQLAPLSRSFALTWSYIHDVLKYYVAKLRDDKTDLDESTVFVLYSYLRLIYVIASDSPEARGHLWDFESKNMVAVLFEFLKFQTPLYAPIFSCLSGFVVPEKTDELWTMVDDWAFNAIVYKPASNGLCFSPSSEPRFDLLLTSISDATGFIGLVSKLAQNMSSTAVPKSPHLVDYCNFVAKVFVWSKSLEDLSERTSLQSACIAVFSSFLKPLDGKLVQVPLALAQSLNMDKLVEGDATINQFLAKFPFKAVTELCLGRNFYEVLFSMLRQPIESLTPEIAQGATAAADLVSLLLQNKKPSSFEKPVLYNLDIISYLATFSSSGYWALALASVKLVQRIALSDLFMPSPTRRDRIVAVLETAPNVGNIKLGLIENFADAKPEVQTAILELLLQGIGSKQATFAHYLLGFRLGNDQLTVDTNLVGAIGTGASLLESICGLLKVNVRAMDRNSINLEEAHLAYLLSEVLLKLVQSPLSSALTLNFLRSQEDFLLELLKLEPVVSTRTLWQGIKFSATFSFESAQAFYYFFKRRAALLDMVALEFHTSSKRQTFSLLARYVKVLMNLQSQSSRSVLHFLDFLKFRPDAPAPVPAQIKPNDPHGPLDVGKLRLMLLVSPLNSDKSDDELVQLYERSLIHLKIKTAQLECLRPWSQLVPILVNDTRNVAREQDTTTFVLETIQTLVPKLVESSRSDLTFCKPLASLLVLLLERYMENHSDDLIGLDRLHSLYRAAMMCIPSSLTFASLRTDLYVIGYQTLQMTLQTHQRELQEYKLAVVNSLGDRIIESICTDALCEQQDLRLVALVFLQTLATTARETGDESVQSSLIRSNMLQLLVQSLVSAPLVDAKVTLCLMLELAQSRSGAEFLLQSDLITKLSHMYALAERQGQGLEYDLYLIVFQLLTALVLSMGQSSDVPERVRRFIHARYQQVSAIERVHDMGAPAPSGPPARCANAVTRLIDIVGYKHI